MGLAGIGRFTPRQTIGEVVLECDLLTPDGADLPLPTICESPRINGVPLGFPTLTFAETLAFICDFVFSTGASSLAFSDSVEPSVYAFRENGAWTLAAGAPFVLGESIACQPST
ncbi:MAG: hypothetical protein ACXIUM_11280 [Wenzhouxiangella sp.]